MVYCSTGDCCSDIDTILDAGINSCWPVARPQIYNTLRYLQDMVCEDCTRVVPNGTEPYQFAEEGWGVDGELPSPDTCPILTVIEGCNIWMSSNNVACDLGLIPAVLNTGTDWCNICSAGSTTGNAVITPGVFEGRITLSPTEAVSLTDITGVSATTLYLLPFNGSSIALYDGTAWVEERIPAVGISTPILATTNTMYDVFVYNNSGVLTLELIAWANDANRSVALSVQDGVWVKTGAAGHRYVGNMRTGTVSGQSEDSLLRRFVWNNYNRRERKLLVLEPADTWTYSTATYRPWNNNTANRVEFIRGLADSAVNLRFSGLCNTAINGGTPTLSIGLDSTTTSSAEIKTPMGLSLSGTSLAGSVSTVAQAEYRDNPPAGYHYLQALEYVTGSALVNFRGDAGNTATIQGGMTGYLNG